MKTASCTRKEEDNVITAQDVGGAKTVATGLIFIQESNNKSVDANNIPIGIYPVTNNVIVVNNVSIKVEGLSPDCTTLLFMSEYTELAESKIDKRSDLFEFPTDVFIVINETIRCLSGKDLQVVPLKYDEYFRLMSKPYKRPLKYQAWRLINSGYNFSNTPNRYVEIIAGPNDVVTYYTIRYIRQPKPIIVGPLEELTINGYKFITDNPNYSENNEEDEDTEDGENNEDSNNANLYTAGCELDPMLHEEILQRAVELAKIAWTAEGNENASLVIQSGKRSE